MNYLCVCALFIVSAISYSSGDDSDGVIHKICTENFDRDACQQISRDQQYACTEDTRSMVDCFLNIDQDLPHFAIVKPEDALLAAPLVTDRVVVVGEVVADNTPFQTVVIVRRSSYDSNNYETLRGKRFCHPGFKHDELVSRLVLEEFESTIINVNSNFCNAGDDSSTIVEKRIRALSEFLGPSCRPGKWTDSDELDAQLKSKYTNLCDICGNDRCNVNYQVPFNDTLSCLIDSQGDVAITTLSDAQVFFSSVSNIETFQYLCVDGTTSISPCLWTKQLNRLIVTGRDSASTVKSYLENKLPSYISAFSTQSVGEETYVAALVKVLVLARSDKISLFDPETLSSYVNSRRTIPTVSNSIQCNTSIKWCTLNDAELQKCKWLQQAALNTGLQPVIECVRSNETDALSCLNDIKSGKADIAFTDVNYGYIALKKGLSVIAYPETDTRQLSSILIAVRTNETNIKSLSDLQGKPACFPEYGGKEWLAFVDILRSKKIVENSCEYGKLFSDFVGNSCVPAANSADYEIENSDISKLCSQCIPSVNTLTHAYCNADSNNKYYGTDGALKCLNDQAGDYAVVTRNDILSDTLNGSDFLVLAKNGSLASYTGFNVDEGAPLTIITAGGIVAKINNTKRDDAVLLLMGIELEFGQRIDKSFKVFESFNNTKDLLFPDSTPGLTFGSASSSVYVDNFITLLKNSERCIINNDPSAAAITVSSTALIAFVVYFTLRL